MAISEQSPQEFFDILLNEALIRQSLKISGGAHVHLLYMLVEPAGPREDNHARLQAPLAERWLKAIGEANTVLRHQLLRSIGDDALRLCGIWWQYVHRVYRQPLNPQYHIGIGRMAYRQIDHEPFDELAEKFQRLIDVFMDVSQSSKSLRTDEDIIRLVRMWDDSHNRYAAQALAREGIFVGSSRA